MSVFYKIQKYSLPSFIHKLLVLFVKLPLGKFLDFLNLFYKQPIFNSKVTVYVNTPTLDELEVEYKYKLRFDDGHHYIYREDPIKGIDDGDQCTHNGLYSSYLFATQSEAAIPFFVNYLDSFIRPLNDNKFLTIIRGLPARDSASGDQMVDMTLAVHEYQKTGVGIEDNKFIKFINDLCYNNDFKITDFEGKPTRHGMMNPNFFLIAKKVPIILAALLVAGKHYEFEYLWDDCGYKYLINNPDPYLWDGKDKGLDRRDWFGSRIAGITLPIMYYHLTKEDDKKIVKKALMKILNRDKWNLWIWLLALDNGVITKDEIPQESLDYFETFRVKTFNSTSEHYPLGNQNTDFVWQRSPFKHDDNGDYNGNVDFLYAKVLKDKYNL